MNALRKFPLRKKKVSKNTEWGQIWCWFFCLFVWFLCERTPFWKTRSDQVNGKLFCSAGEPSAHLLADHVGSSAHCILILNEYNLSSLIFFQNSWNTKIRLTPECFFCRPFKVFLRVICTATVFRFSTGLED